MKTKVIATKLFPKGNIVAITLFGLVFTRDAGNVTKRLLDHELIHCRQQLELLYIPFFILYVAEWLVRLLRYRSHSKAYYNISFEREAYRNESNPGYLKKRSPYNWIHYLRK